MRVLHTPNNHHVPTTGTTRPAAHVAAHAHDASPPHTVVTTILPSNQLPHLN